MITKFKLFESLNDSKLKVGDYVICDEGIGGLNFVKNNIGQYIKNIKNLHDDPMYDRWLNDCDYLIKYDNVPSKLERFIENDCRAQHKSCIKYWSSNKEDLEMILQAKKYNL